MEPVTHMLTGAVLARTGFHRKALYATAAMTIAAELPDADTIWGFAGPVASLEHHRGITHTLVAAPVEAAVVTAACYLVYRSRKPAQTKAPANWLLLFAGTLLALLSHILLDWTNNYGVRPFFPFNPRWYAGSFVFIFEPVLFAILVAALVLPALFGLINAEVGTRKRRFTSPGWSFCAIFLIATLYVVRYTQRGKALSLAAQAAPADAIRFFADPHPVDPFRWSLITETPAAYQLATVSSRTGEFDPTSPSDTLYKPSTTLALMAAKRTHLGRIYLDWSMYPVLSETPDNSDPNHPLTLVTFEDGRFLYNTSFMRGRDHAPLSGSVLLDMAAPEGERVVESKMNGAVQKEAGAR